MTANPADPHGATARAGDGDGDGRRADGGGDGGLPEAYRLLMADVYELAGRSRQTSEALARSLGQTVARWHVMSVLSDGPRSVAGAARRLGLARQSVQRVADQLLADGLARTTPDPADARAPRLFLTPAGHGALAALVGRSDGERERQLARSGLTVGDLRAARRVLRSLVQAVGDSGGGAPRGPAGGTRGDHRGEAIGDACGGTPGGHAGDAAGAPLQGAPD